MFEDIIDSAKNNLGSGSASNSVTEEIRPEVDEDSKIRISVIGIGGAGCNSVNRLAKGGIKSAKTIAMNTDGKHLLVTEAQEKILIGKKITRGLGAGGYPDIARKAAEADEKLIRNQIGENELVFLCAGMGGGTGTGASPVVARIAKEQGAIVVAIVTYPFVLERVRLKTAQQGINELVKIADTVVVIDNNRLMTYAPNLPVDDAFKLADSIIYRAVKGISDTIMFPSLINVDFADVKAVMQTGGLSMISLGQGSGVDKVERVVKDTLEHPLLDVSYENAKGCLLHLEGGADLTLGDAILIGEKITASFSEDSSVKVGARVDPSIPNAVKATAIITGVTSPYIMGKGNQQEESAASSGNIEYM